jgi:ribosome-binding protein aMBF1 (putative translation factor)
MKVNKKYAKPAGPFFKKLMNDPDVRFHYEESKAKSKIAAAVKTARLRAHLSQAKLAEKIGTTQSVIARLESGTDQRTPTLPLLAHIATACGVDLEIGFKFKHAV